MKGFFKPTASVDLDWVGKKVTPGLKYVQNTHTTFNGFSLNLCSCASNPIFLLNYTLSCQEQRSLFQATNWDLFLSTTKSHVRNLKHIATKERRICLGRDISQLERYSPPPPLFSLAIQFAISFNGSGIFWALNMKTKCKERMPHRGFFFLLLCAQFFDSFTHFGRLLFSHRLSKANFTLATTRSCTHKMWVKHDKVN